jgi:electron transfer flavoprotein alpha/beta subunit
MENTNTAYQNRLDMQRQAYETSVPAIVAAQNDANTMRRIQLDARSQQRSLRYDRSKQVQMRALNYNIRR